MPSASDITLYDAAATPVAHVYTPLYKDGTMFVFENGEALTPQGRAQVKIRLTRSAPSGRVNRVNISASKPVETTVDGVTTVTSVFRHNQEFLIPADSTDIQRDDFLKEIASLFDTSMAISYVKDLAPAY